MSNKDAMTKEEKLALADKVIEQQRKQKQYDRWYVAKQKHDWNELKRVVHENGLEDQLQPFPHTKDEF